MATRVWPPVPTKLLLTTAECRLCFGRYCYWKWRQSMGFLISTWVIKLNKFDSLPINQTPRDNVLLGQRPWDWIANYKKLKQSWWCCGSKISFGLCRNNLDDWLRGKSLPSETYNTYGNILRAASLIFERTRQFSFCKGPSAFPLNW